MKLYYSPGACSLSPHIVAEEAGLDCELVRVDTKTHKLPDGSDFYAINPLGYIPLLQLADGQTLHEGPAIVQYLADQAPDKKLLPPVGDMARYRALSWLNFVSTELHQGFIPLFAPGAPEAYKPFARERLLKRFAWVDEQLAGKDYLLGSDFCVADAYLFTVSGWGKFVGVDTSNLANLQTYLQRVGSRPAVQAALRAEGLL